jgi:hypothetical protein
MFVHNLPKKVDNNFYSLLTPDLPKLLTEIRTGKPQELCSSEHYCIDYGIGYVKEAPQTSSER